MDYMSEALRLAEYGRYSVAPNPLVGCIIVRDGEIVGRGYHQRVGESHAEILALSEAGLRAKNANVYITLEPCCHYGRTPPCVDALIAAQVKSVHIPFIDPNPLVNGRSVSKLEAAGIEVYLGEGAQQAKQQNEVFLHHIATARPFVIAKWAMTLDGKIAITNTNHARNSGGVTNSKNKDSLHWITQPTARKHAHYTRCWLGAVLVGVDTIISDDPQLTPYLIDEANECMIGKQLSTTNKGLWHYPWRIVLDGGGRTPLTAKVLHAPDPEKTIIATTKKSSAVWRQQLNDKGVTVLLLPLKAEKSSVKPSAADLNHNIDLPSLLAVLGTQQINGLLVEGGQKVLTSFVKEQLVNKFHIYLAPKLVGDLYQKSERLVANAQARSLSPLANLDITNFAQACDLTYEKIETVGTDLFISAKPKWSQE